MFEGVAQALRESNTNVSLHFVRKELSYEDCNLTVFLVSFSSWALTLFGIDVFANCALNMLQNKDARRADLGAWHPWLGKGDLKSDQFKNILHVVLNGDKGTWQQLQSQALPITHYLVYDTATLVQN